MSLLPIAGGNLDVSGTGDASSVTAITVNLGLGAVTEYTNYEFNSFFEVAGQIYGVKADGVYLLEGDTDNGTEVDAAALCGVTDLPNESQYGSADDSYKDKTITNAYLGLRGFTDVGSLRTRINETIDRLYNYPGTRAATLGEFNAPFQLAKGLKGRFWQFGYENANGSRFELSEIYALGSYLNRRR